MGGKASTSSTQAQTNFDLHGQTGTPVIGNNNQTIFQSTDAGAVKASRDVAIESLDQSKRELDAIIGFGNNAIDSTDAANSHAANLGQAALDLGRRTVDNSVELYSRGLDAAQISQAGSFQFAGTALQANSDVLQSALKSGTDLFTGFASTLANTVFDLATQDSSQQAKNQAAAFDAVSSITANNTASADTQVLTVAKYGLMAAAAVAAAYIIFRRA